MNLLYVLLLSVLSFNASSAKFFEKPLPTCASIKSYLAYEISLAVKSRCDQVGVVMEVKSLHKAFDSMLSENEASPSECRAACLLIDVAEGRDMADCVKNVHVAPFVNSMMLGGVYNKASCKGMQSDL
jgi:hypothetical protein